MKRRITVITLCLLGGALTQSAVSWSAAWGERFFKSGNQLYRFASLRHGVWHAKDGDHAVQPARSTEFAQSLFSRYANYAVDGSLDGLREVVVREERNWLTTFRFAHLYGSHFRTGKTLSHIELEAGFPFRAFCAEVEDEPWMSSVSSSLRGWSGAVMVRVEVDSRTNWYQHDCFLGRTEPQFEYHPIPLRPLPLGFAANTIIYAMPLLFLAWIPGVIAKRLRRPGRCVKCGYDIADLPRCPECGTLTQPDPAQHSRSGEAA